MPKKSHCTLFWCAEIDCENYRSGCMRARYHCDKYSKCEYCVLQNDIAMQSDGDEDELKCAVILGEITSTVEDYENETD